MVSMSDLINEDDFAEFFTYEEADIPKQEQKQNDQPPTQTALFEID